MRTMASLFVAAVGLTHLGLRSDVDWSCDAIGDPWGANALRHPRGAGALRGSRRRRRTGSAGQLRRLTPRSIPAVCRVTAGGPVGRLPRCAAWPAKC